MVERPTPFRPGEIIDQQGETADYLHVLTSGGASVSATGPDEVRSTVAQLGAGDVFGEIRLITGQPRSATVAATSEVMCYRLDKASLQTLLRRRPALAEAIAALRAISQAQWAGR